jgi:tRNA(Ile)-lysidine synthase
VTALHVNYGLRDDSDSDQAEMEALCERLGIEAVIDSGFGAGRAGAGEGNLQAAASEYRYARAERLRAEAGAAWIATGHTRTDLAETVIYRLASSPGGRAMLGLAPRRGHVVRPLLAIGREEARSLAVGAGLPFHDDPSNTDSAFRRVRIRQEVLPVLREINPAAEQNVAATWAELAEEGDLLAALADAALADAGVARGDLAVSVIESGRSSPLRAADLDELHPAVRRLALRQLAEWTARRQVPLPPQRAAEIWRLAKDPEGGEVELGGGLSAICEAGTIRFALEADPAPDPVDLDVPGDCVFGRWKVRAELEPVPDDPLGPDVAMLDAERLGPALEVRAWRDGDRMRPLGLEGSKSLQDLFTDSHVPRSLRHSLPVVVAGKRIAWVAGVAVSEEFKLTPGSREAAVISAALADQR